MKFPRRGLYAITQTEHKSLDQIVRDVEDALKGGAVVVQYRDKNPLDAVTLASRLLRICHAYQVPLLINDSIELALQTEIGRAHV